MSFNQPDDRELVPVTRRHDSSNAGVDGTITVLNQADALMRRHRVFVAGADAATASAAPTVNASPVDDLPVLTDAVDGLSTSAQIRYIETASPSTHGHLAVANAVDRWLEEELPTAIHEITAELADRLVARLSAKAKTELVARLIKEVRQTRRCMRPTAGAATSS